MHIKLTGRGDGIGANLTFFIGQIIFAINNKLYIKYNRTDIYSIWDKNSMVVDTQKLYDSIFTQTLFDIIDNYNINYKGEEGEELNFNTEDYYSIAKNVTDIKSDLINYFKNDIYDENIFLTKALNKSYEIGFDIKKTILVHLRLSDVKNVSDYDGSICANYLKNKIDNNKIITYKDCRTLYDISLNKQAPIPYIRIEEQIKKCLEKNPNHDVIIITSPGEINYLPYKYIQSEDYNYDLFLLTQADCVILSRSTFSIASLFFGKQKEVYLPLWGHLPIFGLFTKYDNMKYSYFI